MANDQVAHVKKESEVIPMEQEQEIIKGSIGGVLFVTSLIRGADRCMNYSPLPLVGSNHRLRLAIT